LSGSASSFALKAANKQRASFRRWGVMADWKTGCYYTYDRSYEVAQLEAFFKLYEKVIDVLFNNQFATSTLFPLMSRELCPLEQARRCLTSLIRLALLACTCGEMN
jgi:hypothetical protein